MTHHNGARYLNNERVAPNVALRLLQRELAGHPCGAGVHTARAFNECIVPTHKALQLESPNLHIGKFTLDGSSLVCFSLQLESVVLLDYQGPIPRGATGSPQAIGFDSFFQERWRLPLCNDTEQLCRDFCLSLHRGRFLLLASATPQQAGRQGDTAAAAAAATAAGRGGQQQQPTEQQPQQAADAGVAASHADGFRAPSSDCCDVTTFHVVDVVRCVRVDQRVFPQDHFDLSGNACVSLHDNVITLTSICHQTIHLLQVNSDGTLTDVQQIGPQCQPDDAVPVELAAAAEHSWQLQRQHERQQQQYWMHQQARALLPAKHCPPTAVCQCSAQPQQQQQQQQQQRQPVTQQQQQQLVQRGEAAEQAARARGARRRRGGRMSDDSSSSDSDADRGVQGSDGEAPYGRRVRQRLTDPLPAPAQQPQQQVPQPPANLQLQWQRQQQLSTLQQVAGRRPAAAGDGGAAAAAAATSAALLDPGGQLITGLRQRLLAYLYKAISSPQRSEVAPSYRDFQHNFGVLSNLVVWRARLLGRQQLLLKVGAPTSGPAAAADANPNRVHFFSIYDMATTRFTGFWRAGSPLLLSAVLEQPCRFLAASNNLSPLERCCAAALYPVGLPIGLEHTHHHQQQPQQQDEAGDPSTAAQQQPDAGPSGARGAAGPSAPSAAGAAGGVLGEPAAAVRSSNMLAAPSAAAGAAAGAAQLSTVGRPGASSSRAGATGRETTGGDSSGKVARERLKFLRQVVLMVLPGLQNLSPSPYLDPHLFRYSKHISPIIGLRNSPAHAIRFQLAREYPGFYPAVQQQQLGTAAATGPPQPTAAGVGPGQGQPVQQQQQPPQPRRQQHHQQHADMLQLDVTVPPTVVHGGEEVVRRQLHLFHPSDPFVLVVVQTAGQPATLNIYCRM